MMLDVFVFSNMAFINQPFWSEFPEIPTTIQTMGGFFKTPLLNPEGLKNHPNWGKNITLMVVEAQGSHN